MHGWFSEQRIERMWLGICCLPKWQEDGGSRSESGDLLYNHIKYENGDGGSHSGYYLTESSTGHIYSDTFGLSEKAVQDRKVLAEKEWVVLLGKSWVKGISWMFC